MTETTKAKRGLSLLSAAVMLATMLLAVWPVMRAEAADPTAALSGKTAVFFGDSIAAGWRDVISGEGINDYTNSGGWSYRLQRDYGMTSTLKAIAGSSFKLIDTRGEGKWIPKQIQNAGSGTYDYVILEGGFNDAMGANNKPAAADTVSPVGTITNSFFPDDFDRNTFAGELERSFYYIHKQYPNAKVGYIITYQTPNSEYGGVTANADEMRKYWSIAKQICDKWGVKYLDLYDGTAADGKHYSNDVLDMDNSATASVPGNSSSDHIHLTKVGYDRITPYIAQWMTGLTVMPTNYWECGYEKPAYNWNDDYTAPGTPSTSVNYAKISTSQKHNGGQSLKMQSSGYPSAVDRSQTLLRDSSGNLIALTDRNKDYRISFWVYMAGTTEGSLRYYLALDDGDSSFTTEDKDLYKLVESNVNIEKNTWVRITHNLSGMSLMSLPLDAHYIRLGLTSTTQQDTHELWIDDVQISRFGMNTEKADYEQYDAGNDKVGGNGSGREISSTHAHGGNGTDAPGGKAVRLKMNRTGDSNYARTVAQTADGNHLQVATNVLYKISLWAYWAAGEGTPGYTDSLPVTFGSGITGEPYQLYRDMAASGNKSDVALMPNTWQKVSFIVRPYEYTRGKNGNGIPYTMNYLTIGAQFAGASDDRIAYLYLDDIEVNLLSSWDSLNEAVEAPNGALLYTDGTNATYYNTAMGKEVAAMRVMGRYYAASDAADTVCVDGMLLPVISRGILLGNNTATDATLRKDGTYLHKTETFGDKLSTYWDYDTERGQVIYTVLMKNIDSAKKDTAYAYRAFMTVNVNGVSMTVYSNVVKNLSAQNVYNGATSSVPGGLKWFGNVSGSGDIIGDSVPLLDHTDSRYSIVYDADDAQAKAAAEELQKQMKRLFGNKKVVTCASDTAASTRLPYEILVGNTNRGEDDGVIGELSTAASQHDAAFAVKYNNKKVVIAAKNAGDSAKYGIVLGYAVDYFLEQVSDTMAVSTSLDFNSTDKFAASTNGGKVFTVNNYASDLMNNAWIVVEKYPSYMVMEAARDLQKYLATHTGEYVPIMKNQDHTNNATSIYIGPQQGAVRVHYAESDWGFAGSCDPDVVDGKYGVDDGAFDITPIYKKGYVDTNQADTGLLKTGDYGDYEIQTGGGWPAKVTVNGSSVYAVNAGVQKLMAMLTQTGDLQGTQTGNYTDDGQYSLSDGYGMAYEENFDFTSESEVKAKYTVDKDSAPGPTQVDPAVVGEGNYIQSGDTYWDVQSRPAQWGIGGTYYAEGGYLYEYTRKTDNGYSAVRVTTQNKMTYRYGFTEARMVTSTDNGACSAIWAVSTSRPGSEIDVYENFGQDKLVVNMHYWANGVSHSLDGVNKYKTIKSYKSSDRLGSGEHFYDTFHYIGFEWDEYAFTYYIDGEAWLTVDITEPMYNGSTVWIDEAGLEAFRQPIWIKFTNGVGTQGYTGGYDPKDYASGGAHYKKPTNGKYTLNSVEDFCETQVVDYMYIFQKENNGSIMNIG